jgi:hypothetical protein
MKDMIYQYNKERSEAARSLNVKEFKWFCKRWKMPVPPTDRLTEITMRKIICNIVESTDEEKAEAKKWLEERGCDAELKSEDVTKKIPDMDEMIEECRKKQRPDEDICFGFGSGRILPMVGKRKAMAEAMEYIKSLDGFLGVHPIDTWYTILIFDTLNNAKGGRNMIKSKGIECGHIVPLLVEKRSIMR